MKSTRAILLICFIFCFNIAYSQSDSSSFKTERFSVSLGGFYTALGSSVIVGSDDLGVGLSLDLEDALGLRTSAFVLRGETQYTFGKRRNKKASLNYLGLFRTADKVLDSDITLGDITYTASSQVKSEFNLEVYELSYNYGFFQDDRMRLGIGGGFFVMPIEFSVSASSNKSRFFEVVAPLPVIGISTDFYINPKWTFSQSVDLLYIQFGDFSGSLTDINISVDYQAFERFSFGAGVNSFRLNIEAKDELFSGLDFTGNIETSYTGLLLYAKYRLNYPK